MVVFYLREFRGRTIFGEVAFPTLNGAVMELADIAVLATAG